ACSTTQPPMTPWPAPTTPMGMARQPPASGTSSSRKFIEIGQKGARRLFETISMIGLGYIGLPTATLFASRKQRVIGVDINPHAVDTINQGKLHVVEPELDMLVHSAVTEAYLRATTQPEPADAFLIAVPTPFKDGHKPDLSYIESGAKA